METAKKIAVFGPNHKLMAIVAGISQLAKLMDTDTGSILRAIKGERMTCNGFYPRFVPDDTVIDVDDLGFDLIEFDLKWLEEDRLIYTTRNQKRTDVIRESEFIKIRGDRYRHYSFNSMKKKDEDS